MINFNIRRTRIAIDTSAFNGLKDALTGELPINWRGNACQYEVGFFWGLVDGVLSQDNQIIDIATFQSLTMEVKLSEGTVANVMAKTIVTADFGTVTVSTWNDKSAQHCVFGFTDVESNVAPAEYYLVFSGLTASGNVVTLGAGQLTIREDGTPQMVDDPAPNPGAAISLAQADARYALISVAGVALGETNTTAYRGDRGKIAYDHSQIVMGNPHGTTAGDVGAEPTIATDTGWTTNGDAGDKTATIPSSGVIVGLVNTTVAAMDAGGAAGLGNVLTILQIVAERVKAIDGLLASRKFPNA